jgi:predicted TPR repeat methyltransferase
MNQFDKYASTYETAVSEALGIFAKSHGWALQRKAAVIGSFLQHSPTSSEAVPRVLDIGCGIGLVHRH